MSVCLSVCLLSLSLSSLSVPLALSVCVFMKTSTMLCMTLPSQILDRPCFRLRVSFALLYKAMLALSTWLRVLLVTHQILKAKTAQDECRQSLDQNQRGFSTLQVKQGEMKRNEVERINLAEKIAEEFQLDKTLVVSYVNICNCPFPSFSLLGHRMHVYGILLYATTIPTTCNKKAHCAARCAHL